MQPTKKIMARFEQGFHAAKTFPVGVKETTSFLYPDFTKSKPQVMQSQSVGGFVLANKNVSPISRISFAESPIEKVLFFFTFLSMDHVHACYTLTCKFIFFFCWCLLVSFCFIE